MLLKHLLWSLETQIVQRSVGTSRGAWFSALSGSENLIVQTMESTLFFGLWSILNHRHRLYGVNVYSKYITLPNKSRRAYLYMYRHPCSSKFNRCTALTTQSQCILPYCCMTWSGQDIVEADFLMSALDVCNRTWMLFYVVKLINSCKF